MDVTGEYLICIDNFDKEQYLTLNEKYWTTNCCDDIVWLSLPESGRKSILLTLARSRFITLEEYRCVNILEILSSEK
jgi:hypothetical protein